VAGAWKWEVGSQKWEVGSGKSLLGFRREIALHHNSILTHTKAKNQTVAPLKNFKIVNELMSRPKRCKFQRRVQSARNAAKLKVKKKTKFVLKI